MRASRTRAPQPSWADARDVLRAAVGRDAVGRIRLIGEGLSNVVFGAWVDRAPGEPEAVVIKLPSRDAERDRDDRIRAEAALLRHLSRQSLPFSVPRSLGEVETRGGLAAVQEWLAGLEIDFRTSRFPEGAPWELVAGVAAAAHAIDPGPLRAIIGGTATRRDHALELCLVMQELEEPEARDSEGWIRDHLPPATPSRLLHGDLLGQNIKRSLEDGRLALVDWGEARMGDPAYDLAIVTRGRRKPFGHADGLTRLVQAYNRVAEAPLGGQEVRLYEVIIAAHQYREVKREFGAGSPHAENYLSAWRSMLERTRGA